MAFGGLRQMKMLFFSNPPHTPHEECSLVFCYYSLSLYISLSISLFLVLPLIWTLTSKSAPRMSVTNCSPTLWQCFFSSRAVYDLLFFLFLFFFSVFFPFQGLAHLTLNDQGMGSFFFILVMIFFFFFFVEELTQPLHPQPHRTMAFAIIVLLSFSHPLGASSLHCFLKSFLSFHHMHIPHPDPINLHLHSFFPCSSCRPSCAVLRALVHFCIVTPICVPIPFVLVLWLTSWTFTSDHIWPPRPDPGGRR